MELNVLEVKDHLKCLEEHLSDYKEAGNVPPLSYRNLILLLIVEANQSTKAQRWRGFFLAQEAEFINWTLRLLWEDLVIDSRNPRSEKKQT